MSARAMERLAKGASPEEVEEWLANYMADVERSRAEAIRVERLNEAAPDMLDELRRAEQTLRTIPAWAGQADAIARLISKATGAQQ